MCITCCARTAADELVTHHSLRCANTCIQAWNVADAENTFSDALSALRSLANSYESGPHASYLREDIIAARIDYVDLG